ncbi:Peroxisomal 2,4-dienoyl-CoA reductase SPS19 [Wickerhamiella sorbophila]|uniref:2,4-dienoyl-CoA reductase [(3E)-enoyl-CoA-producing] n=1 Tax=Wickerhamiella sorbophila TaxID=45607 RepID=A0A2T0FH20_9ASCO|nr:Peroxisomal 2,4-dienoyl-CoA reductase SPS19 [Wickerhamiella sorbophila]PRT54285.1 Peroxisomal 2,4-dienoyl-CoA reductase SPS19 [Wickerhamiella sorbophila]
MPNTLSQDYKRTCVWKDDLFAGKVVFVTGGAGSICRVQTEAMVLLGADAVIVGRNGDKAAAAAREVAELRPGAKVLSFAVDVRDINTILEAVKQTVESLGRIDYVIAGAAGNFLAPITGLSANAFKTVIDIDLNGSFNTAKATLPELLKTKGSVVFVSATLHYRGLPFQAHPAAAKAGVDSLMKTIAVEFGPLGIRSNALAPGPIEGTEGMSRLGKGSEHNRQRSYEMIPLGRYGTTQEIADGTVYLFSPAAHYVTGQVLVVDGGQWQTTSPRMDAYPSVMLELAKQPNKI